MVDYVQVGTTSMEVSEVCLGAWMFSIEPREVSQLILSASPVRDPTKTPL